MDEAHGTVSSATVTEHLVSTERAMLDSALTTKESVIVIKENIITIRKVFSGAAAQKILCSYY